MPGLLECVYPLTGEELNFGCQPFGFENCSLSANPSCSTLIANPHAQPNRQDSGSYQGSHEAGSKRPTREIESSVSTVREVPMVA